MRKNISSIQMIVAFTIVITLTATTAFATGQGTLSVGSAMVKITPKTPIPMSGYGSRKDAFEAVHDDLFARAIVFGDGEKKAAVITADVIGFSNNFLDDLIAKINRETGIGRDCIMLCPAHNHGGPVTGVYNELTPAAQAYADELKDNLLRVVIEAAGKLKPAQIGARKGECLMNINRRALLPNGEITLGRNPGGPCDHEVGVVLITDANGKPSTVLYNWPSHGTVMGPKNYQITGDWPGAASRYVETNMGDGVIAPVTIGASGDINPIYGPHIDFVSEYRGYSFSVDAIGMILGKEVIRVAKDIVLDDNGSINAAQRIIELPKRTDKSTYQQPETGSSDGLKVRLSVMKVGTVVFAGVSGEVFNEIGMTLKERSPYSNTFMITHCNGSSGYLITDKAYDEGGYEARSTRAKSGAEHAIIDNLLDMINGL